MSDSTAVALFGKKSEVMPTYLSEQDAGLGNENVSSEDLAIPQISLLQPLSPQVEEIEGAKAGLFFNNINEETYESFYVMNLGFKKEFAVFRKRNRGGGFHGNFGTQAEALEHIATLPGDSADYDAVETAKHLCLRLDDEGKPAHAFVYYLKSTGLSVSRKWNADLSVRNEGAARFATVWSMSSKLNQNDKGRWYTPVIQFEGYPPEDLYAAAKEYYESVNAAIE